MIRTVRQRFKKMNGFSVGVIKLGFLLAAGYCLVSIVSCILFFYSPEPQRALQLIHAGLSGATPMAATMFCAAVICDLIFHDMKKKSEKE